MYFCCSCSPYVKKDLLFQKIYLVHLCTQLPNRLNCSFCFNCTSSCSKVFDWLPLAEKSLSSLLLLSQNVQYQCKILMAISDGQDREVKLRSDWRKPGSWNQSRVALAGVHSALVSDWVQDLGSEVSVVGFLLSLNGNTTKYWQLYVFLF